jgi:hypothetical protein
MLSVLYFPNSMGGCQQTRLNANLLDAAQHCGDTHDDRRRPLVARVVDRKRQQRQPPVILTVVVMM